METIFKTDKFGRNRIVTYDVRDEENGTATIIKTSGLDGGKMTTTETLVKLGYESAMKRMKTMVKNEKQPIINPTLANNWEDRKHKVKFPVYVQPKLDGVRMLLSNKGGISRTGKIVKGTENWGKNLKDGEYLDGECYVHGMKFEDITSAFKTQPEKLKFCVFDYFDINNIDMTFEQRMKKINVETILIDNVNDIDNIHDKFVNLGYEGIMIRNPKSVYEMFRTDNLLKYKKFKTEEFKVIGYHEGSGRDVNTPIWECETSSKEVFSVRPEGTLKDKREKWINRDEYIGKLLTVKFQNETKNGIPRFPVGIAFRDYE